MTKSSWVRGDLTAPTTPEQCHAAMQRQERVIDRLREERDELAARCEQLVQQNDQANHKNRELMARCERLREKCDRLTFEIAHDPSEPDFKSFGPLMDALAETPAASLAHVRAEAIEEAADAIKSDLPAINARYGPMGAGQSEGFEGACTAFRLRAQSIRQSASQNEIEN